MGKFIDDSKALLEYVGGKENIGAVTHCVTRMRFVLKDTSLANKEKIESLKSVKGTFIQAGQFQVIIGNSVGDFYNDFVKISGVEGTSKDDVKDAAKSNMTFMQRLMANLAEIFSPLIPAIIVGGLILGFRNLIGDIKFFEDGTKSLIEISQFWAGTHSFLWLIGEAIFHFLPVGITWAITKKMGTTQILGIVLGITLVSPQLLNAYAVSSGGEIPVWDFGFAQVNMIGYQAQVIPAILAGFLLVYLEKFFRKITPASISMIIVPFFALVPTVLIAHVVLGPIGWTIGSWISTVVYAGLTSSFRWLFAGIFGFAYAPLVITGLHHMTNAIDLQLMAQVGGTSLWPMIALSNIAQGSAVLAMIYLHRKSEEEKQVSIPACISAYLGVTEPALFGINLKYGFPFISGMIGSGIAAIISVGSGVMANAIGIGGIPGILSIQPNSIPMFAVSMVVAIVVPFILTVVIGRKKINVA
ncbi:PTS system trehalose-specific EIIBC component [Clostridium septicum]|uniref:PTS system trehalose-specific EIIBC component n=1 Tax=Clostridium septicum TaxID=1504 RepID=A0A9N7PL66_CLOSE|nr:PTS system trehalose-specific EIIBC component [Clostridium septicum]AYE34261.1 PTS trehalose transporter subunit IIBC [Clostridium septicum]MDU1313293.1 PTS system trehalose-specific EIIBC component [Clostridium septicum]QAS59668.1 PTS trehalose transporter subunit IIBC [Clostridium septicum]UEC21101.1 PTS system trehalose-specific EIIBC component [Clostridium septicum]USS00850.1 PTS system trehalose-specific EIIBC component [Clostridium septicum]